MLACGVADGGALAEVRSLSTGAGAPLRPEPTEAAIAECAARASMAEVSSNSISGINAFRSSWEGESSGESGFECGVISKAH
jgi:hypothetical protein